MHSDSTAVRTCRVCGATSDQVKIRVGRRRCSPCEWKIPGARAKGETRTCRICRQPFYLPPSRAKDNAECCSKKCMGAARTLAPEKKAGEIRSCATCHESFFVWNADLRRSDQRANLYCSHKCRPGHPTGAAGSERTRAMGMANVGKFRGPLSARYRGGRGRKPDYGPNWYLQAKAARERDGHKCQDCGAIRPDGIRKQHDVHHLIPLRKSAGDFETANALSNLITLCQRCHKRWEQALQALYAPWV